MVNIFKNTLYHTKYFSIFANIFDSTSHILHNLKYFKYFTYFTMFHSISQYFTMFHGVSQYTHQDRLVSIEGLLTLPVMLSLLQADPNPPAAQIRSRNPNLSRNLRFSIGWQRHHWQLALPVAGARWPAGSPAPGPSESAEAKLSLTIIYPGPCPLRSSSLWTRSPF